MQTFQDEDAYEPDKLVSVEKPRAIVGCEGLLDRMRVPDFLYQATLITTRRDGKLLFVLTLETCGLREPETYIILVNIVVRDALDSKLVHVDPDFLTGSVETGTARKGGSILDL